MTLEPMGVLLDLAFRATLLLAVGALALAALRQGSAAHRHLVLLGLLAALLLLPVLSRVVVWELPILPTVRAAAAPELSELVEPPAALLESPSAPTPGPFSPLPWALMIWGGGSLALLLRWSWRLLALRFYSGRCRPIRRLELLEVVDGLAWRMGVRTIVRCVESEAEAGAPMTWGWQRPVVALPRGAERWPAERLRAVLLHELAHVERRDWLWQQLAGVVCALYWFHPGVWWAAARLRAESETACDDRVLAAGMPAPDYARSLLEVVQTMHGKQTLPAVTMARGSGLERRIRAILGHRRRGMMTPGAALAAVVITAAVVLPIAATRVTARAASEAEPTASYLAPPAAAEVDAPAPEVAPPTPPAEVPEVEVRPVPPPAPEVEEPAAPRPPLTEREKRLLELERKARALTERSGAREPEPRPLRGAGPDRVRIEALIREKMAHARAELERAHARLEATRPERERALEKLKGLHDPELRKKLESVREEVERHLSDPAVRKEIDPHLSDPAVRKELDAAREHLKRRLSDDEHRKHLERAREHLKGFSEDDVRKHLDAAREQMERALAQKDATLRERAYREQTEAGKRRRGEDRNPDVSRLEEQVATLRAQQESLRRQIERMEEQLRKRK